MQPGGRAWILITPGGGAGGGVEGRRILGADDAGCAGGAGRFADNWAPGQRQDLGEEKLLKGGRLRAPAGL